MPAVTVREYPCPLEPQPGWLYRDIHVGLVRVIGPCDDGNDSKQLDDSGCPDISLDGRRLPRGFLSSPGNFSHILRNQVVTLVSFNLSLVSFNLSLISRLVPHALNRKELADFCAYTVDSSIHSGFNGLDPGIEFFAAYRAHDLSIATFARCLTDWILM